MYIAIFLFVLFLIFILRHKYLLKYSKFPSGPLSIPIIGSIFSVGTMPHEAFSKLKNKYGNIVAFDLGANRGIILNDLDTIKDAFSKKEFQVRPDIEAAYILRGENLSGIAFSKRKDNEEQRAFVIKTLKNFGMGKKSIENLLQEEMQRLFETFDKQLEIPVVNKDLFLMTAVSALWSIMTGEHGRIEESKFVDIVHTVRKAGISLNIFTLFLPALSKLFPRLSGWNDLIKSGSDIAEYATQIIEAHRNTYKVEEEPKDLVEAYLQKIENTQDEKSSFFGQTGVDNLVAVLGDFIGGGTETVSACLSWFLAVVIHNPNVQDKIKSEIERVIGGNRLPSLSDRPALPYIECVIYELLRYSSVIPLGLPHATSEDVEMQGYLIPKGTVVMPNAYEALHNTRRWDESEMFKPERFLSNDGITIERSVTRNVDIVFGHGKRACPGETLAKDQLFIYITGLCQRYIFQKDPKCKYGGRIPSKLAISLVPVPHSLIITKR